MTTEEMKIFENGLMLGFGFAIALAMVVWRFLGC